MRSSFLLLALVGMASAQVWQQMPPAKPDELFEGIPKQLPKKNNALIRIPAKNPQQWSLILDDGTIFTEQTLLTKMDVNSIVNDVERYLELLAFAHEYNEWGINGPPTGFSITKARTPFVVKRKKRSLDKPISDDDFKKLFLAVVQKFKEHQKKNKALSNPTPEQLGVLSELLTNENTSPDSYELPQHFVDFFKLAWKVANHMPKEGFKGAIERATKELAQKATSEKRKREAETTDDEFATIVYDQKIGEKGLDIAVKKLKKRALTGSKAEPSLQLKGSYYLVPKAWNRDQIEKVYNDLRKKRTVVRK